MNTVPPHTTKPSTMISGKESIPAAGPASSSVSRVTTKIAALVDGNGILAGQVRQVSSDLQDYTLDAELRVTLAPKLSENRQTGKVSFGTVVQDKAAVNSEASSHAKDFLSSETVKADILKHLEKLPVEGWGAEDLKFDLPETKKEYAVQDKCNSCQGAGSGQCPTCNGQGKMTCNFCKGYGKTECRTCAGLKRIKNAAGQDESCPECSGKGMIPCHVCNEKKYTPCPTCNGQKKIACPDCGQSGWTTYCYTVVQQAKVQFVPQLETLPEEVQQAVTKVGIKNLGTDHHADIARDEGQMRETAIVFPFQASFSYGTVAVSLAGQSVTVTTIGQQGYVVESEPFLDKLVKPGIAALYRLTKGQMAAQSLLATACRYRLLRGVLSGLSTKPKRDVLQQLVRDYPVGLSDKYARATVSYADNALKGLSRKPRQHGLITGLLIGIALYAGWFLSPARTFIGTHIVQMNLGAALPVVDFAVFLIGWLVAVYCVKSFAAKGYEKLLPASLKAVREKGLPPAGEHLFYALPVLLVAYVLLIEQMAAKPGWYQSIMASF